MIVAVIPARGGSKAIPDKNIIDFCGKPLIAWTIEAAKNVKSIDKVYVSTNDERIAEISKTYGAEIIDRPDELSTDTSSADLAMLHAIEMIEKSINIDTVVFLQATSPVRTSCDISQAIDKFLNTDANSLFSVAKLEDYCIWKFDEHVPKSITYDYKNRGMRQDREPCYLENGSVYIFSVEAIKRYKNRICGKIVKYEMPLWKSYEIDSYEDLEICEYFMKKMLKEEKKQLKGIELIVYDFDGVMTDNKAILHENGFESVVVNRSDGLAISLVKKLGIHQLILSSEENPVVKKRAQKLQISVIHGIKNKSEAIKSYCAENGFELSNTLYVGNDLNDYDVMKLVGFPVCPRDANERIKNISKHIFDNKGGNGVIMELYSMLL